MATLERRDCKDFVNVYTTNNWDLVKVGGGSSSRDDAECGGVVGSTALCMCVTVLVVIVICRQIHLSCCQRLHQRCGRIIKQMLYVIIRVVIVG